MCRDGNLQLNVNKRLQLCVCVCIYIHAEAYTDTSTRALARSLARRDMLIPCDTHTYISTYTVRSNE